MVKTRRSPEEQEQIKCLLLPLLLNIVLEVLARKLSRTINIGIYVVKEDIKLCLQMT